MSALGAPFQVTHASGLRALNRVLASMHTDMLRAGGLDGGAVRLAVLNIVAACMDVDSADVASQAAGRLGGAHPARAIIIIADGDAPTHIEADVSLQCSAVDRGQVCAEQVRLSVGGAAAFHLASIVTPLLVHDVPVYLWLVGSPPLEQAFGLDAIAVCERLIVDSGAYADTAATLRTLSAELASVGDAISFGDMAWERTRLWRRLIAQCFDGPELRGFVRGIAGVVVEDSGQAASAQAWLLAGWLDSRLRARNGASWPGVVMGALGTTEARGDGPARVSLRCTSGEHRAVVTVERRGAALHSIIDVDGGIGAEGAVPVRDVDDVELLGQLLESPAEDPVYRLALASAATLAGGTSA